MSNVSKIRVRFNRQITWAEVESWRDEFRKSMESSFSPDVFTWHFDENRTALYISSPYFPSREMYAAVAEEAERGFVNLHPVAVRTFSD